MLHDIFNVGLKKRGIMTIQAYELGGSGFTSVPNPPILSPRNPATTDIVSPAGNPYQIGQYWENTTTATVFFYIGGGNWEQVASPTLGPIDTITGNSGGAIGPTLSNVNIVGTGSITIAGAGSTLTTQLTGLTNHNVLVGAGTATITDVPPSATVGVALVSTGAAADPAFGTVVVAGGGTGAVTLTGVLTGNGTSAVTANAVTQHGVLLGGAANAVSSLGVAATGTVLAGVTGADPAFTGSPSVSGSLTAATTITATLGNITATNGNFVASTAGSGLVLPVATASGGTPQTCNGRVGACTFTGVSIASGATQSFVINNTSITGAGTHILYSMVGVTTGAALSISAVTNGAGTSTIVVTNGTSATMVTTVTNITLHA